MSTNFLEPDIDIGTVSYSYNNAEDFQLLETNDIEESTVTEKQTIYSRISRWFLLFGVFALPLFFLPLTTGVLELNKQVLLIVLAGAVLISWLLHVVSSGQLSWRFNSIDKGVVAFLSAVLLATIFSITRFKSLFGLTSSSSDSLVTILAVSVFYFGVVNLFDDKGAKVRMFLGCSIFVTLLYGVLNMLGIGVFKYLKIPMLEFASLKHFNTLGTSNSLGVLAAVVLPFLYKSKMPWKPYFDLYKISIGLAVLVLIALNWWVLWVVAIAGMATLIVLDSLNSKNREIDINSTSSKLGVSRFLFPMTIIILGVFLVIVNFNWSFIKKDFPVEVAPSFELSSDIASSILKERIVFGYGPENFSLAFDKFGAGNLANTSLSDSRFFDSNSQIFNFVVHGGIVLLAAFIFVLWLLAETIIKHRNSEALHGSSGVVSMVMALVVAMFLYPFNTSLLFIFWLSVGLMVLILWGDRKKVFNVEERASTSLISSLGFIGGLILVLVGLYFGTTLYFADFKFAKALTEQNPEKSVSFLVEAINWNNKDDRYYRTSSQAALNLLLGELKKKENEPDRTSKIQNYITTSINLAKRATEISQEESYNWITLGVVYQNLIGVVDGVEKLAEDAYLKAAELRVGDASFYNRIGGVYLTRADLSRQIYFAGGANASKHQQEIVPALLMAEDNFKKAIGISENFGLAIYNLGAVYDRLGKVKDAIKQLEKIAPFNNNQPNLAFELGLLYYRDGQKDKAFKQLERVVLLSPNFSNARWYLGLLLEERQDISGALEQMEKILSIEENKNNQTVLIKLNELKNGKKNTPPKKILDQKPL